MITIINMNKDIKDFTRNEMIYHLENLIRRHKNRDDLNLIWDTCINFNDDHSDEEIFLSYDYDDGLIFLEDDAFPLKHC